MTTKLQSVLPGQFFKCEGKIFLKTDQVFEDNTMVYRVRNGITMIRETEWIENSTTVENLGILRE
jgi:ABC-type phosphate transport system ATPase subunit